METVDDDGDDPLVGAYVQSPTEDIDCDTNYYPSQSQPQTKKAPRRPSSAAAAFPPLPPPPQPPVSDPDLANAIMVAANTGVEFHVRFASGATIAISPSSAPAASPSSKPLTRWSQSVGTQWHEKNVPVQCVTMLLKRLVNLISRHRDESILRCVPSATSISPILVAQTSAAFGVVERISPHVQFEIMLAGRHTFAFDWNVSMQMYISI